MRYRDHQKNKRMTDSPSNRVHSRKTGSWSYSVMVITQDFEFCDPGSSPGRTCFFIPYYSQNGGIQSLVFLVFFSRTWRGDGVMSSII